MELSKDKIAGICVTYNPSQEIHNTLAALSRVLEFVIVVDNSDSKEEKKKLEAICGNYENVNLIDLGENKGIAYALNRGCEIALKLGYTWALTLDQDSILPGDTIEKYINAYNQLSRTGAYEIGMLTCDMSTWSTENALDFEEVKQCWTSGALMSLETFNKVGGFDEKLFIDAVDFDMCLKYRSENQKIIKVNSVRLKHSLGRTKDVKVLKKHLFYVTNHSALRRYYMTRNGFYISKKYSNQYPEIKIGVSKLVKIIFKILLFETDKMEKFRYMYRGYIDYRNNKFGKYQA